MSFELFCDRGIIFSVPILVYYDQKLLHVGCLTEMVADMKKIRSKLKIIGLKVHNHPCGLPDATRPRYFDSMMTCDDSGTETSVDTSPRSL